MPYNEEKLTKLKALKQLAQRIEADYATRKSVTDLSERVDSLVTAGGEPNKLEAVKVNGEALPITDKAVDVGPAIASAVAAADHLQRRKVDSVEAIDPAAEGADKYIYMVPKTGGKNGDKYDEYMVLDGAVEPVGDWAVDLSGYQPREEGKGLSSNDYTGEEKAKLAGVAAGAAKVAASEIPGNIRINDEETQVVGIASDAEVTEMLTEVFGAAPEVPAE